MQQFDVYREFSRNEKLLSVVRFLIGDNVRFHNSKINIKAAGIGAALAANSGIQPREVSTQLIQRQLLEQGAYLSPSIANALDAQDANNNSAKAVATG